MSTEVATAPLVIESDKGAAVFSSPSRLAKTTPVPASITTSTSATTTPSKTASKAPAAAGSPSESTASNKDGSPSGSPKSKRGEKIPKIIVKKEPSSPGPPSRRRPPKLHLNDSNDDSGSQVPRTAGGNLATMRDVGMACLSPGFATQDPTMREQLQRSASVRDQQRSIIEARLQRHPKTAGMQKDGESASGRGGSSQTPKRRPPNSLSIVPPPHRAFANERVVQSAPLNQSFTGRNHPQQTVGSNLQHSTTNNQQVNRLPPISDVFASERIDGVRTSRPLEPSRNPSSYYPIPRPQPSPNNNLGYSRPREHRSAEEALAHMSGGREDLLPRIIHYGGHQPPTPPSPPTHQGHTPNKIGVDGRQYEQHFAQGRRRTRAEYENDNDGPGSRDSPETKRQKKEEFLSLCARAWELFHS